MHLVGHLLVEELYGGRIPRKARWSHLPFWRYLVAGDRLVASGRHVQAVDQLFLPEKLNVRLTLL